MPDEYAVKVGDYVSDIRQLTWRGVARVGMVVTYAGPGRFGVMFHETYFYMLAEHLIRVIPATPEQIAAHVGERAAYAAKECGR